jgi:cardiolipin synthase A/B
MIKDILALATSLAGQLSPAKVQSIASRVSGDKPPSVGDISVGIVGSTETHNSLERLLSLCVTQNVSGDLLAGILLGASAAGQRLDENQAIEVVWTGPTTPNVPTRRMDQVLLDLIRSAEREIFIVSFVAYDFAPIVEALNSACRRGLIVKVLLEASKAHGGSLDVDPVAMMKRSVPSALCYVWVDRKPPFEEGRVHAKIALSDDQLALLSSANLTGHAMAKNMEAGLLIRGGPVPINLKEHLNALIDTKVLREI